MTRPAIQRRFTVHSNTRRQYGIDTAPVPFDPRPRDQRDTIIDPSIERLLMNVDDPVIRADVLAERTDHAPLQTMAVYEPADKPHAIVRAACYVFDLFSPDSANERPMTAGRRAAMHSDRETLKQWLIWLAQAACVLAIGWSVLQILAGIGRAWGTA
jgi:hypothetical protein